MGAQSQVVRFQNHHLQVVEIDGKKGFTSETIGYALEYAEPRRQVVRQFNRNKEEFESGVDYSVVNLTTDAGERETTVFFQTGVMLIGMFSKQPLAKDFRQWAKHVLASVQSGDWRTLAFQQIAPEKHKALKKAYRLRSLGVSLMDASRAAGIHEREVSLFFQLFGDPQPDEVEYKEFPVSEAN